MSITEYKNSNYYMTDIIKIDENKLKKVYSSNKYSKIVFMGNKCTSIDCVLFLDTLEKWEHSSRKFPSSAQRLMSSAQASCELRKAKIRLTTRAFTPKAMMRQKSCWTSAAMI